MAHPAIAKYKHALERAHASTRRAREKAGEVMQTVVHATETGASAFAFGVLEGQSGTMPEPLGIPAPLLAAAVLHGAAAFGVGRGMEDHVKALGNGALAAYAFSKGQFVGSKHKATGQWSLRGEDDNALSAGPSRQGTGVSAREAANFAGS